MAIRIVRVASSLPLQKLLHVNTLYAFCFGSTEIVLSLYKALYLSGINTSTNLSSSSSSPTIMNFMPLILVFVWIIIEILRIRIGYLGNLQERVPELAAFWLLTLLPQLPLTVFISFISLNNLCLGLDIAVGIPICIILIGQIRYGLPAVRALIRKQTADFYRICQEEALMKEMNIHPPKYTTLQQQQRNKMNTMYGNSTGGSNGLPNVTDQELDQAVNNASTVGEVMKEGFRTLTSGNSKDGSSNSNNRLVTQSTNTLLAKNSTNTTSILRTGSGSSNETNNSSGKDGGTGTGLVTTTNKNE